MRTTRRFRVLGALSLAVAILAVLLGKPLLLGVPLGVSGWLVGHQLVFTQTLTDLTDTQPVTQSVTHERALVNDTVTLTITVDAPLQDAAIDGVLSVHPPAALSPTSKTTFDLPLPDASESVPLQVDVADTFTIQPPTVECTDPTGLFRESINLGATCTVTGEPNVPRDVHVGSGGERISVAAGEHDADQGTSGFEPGELREYLPGDPTNRIDWKATARLGEPYVRDVEAETTRRTELIVDCRESMHIGPEGRTKLDFAREISIWLTDHAATHDDPIGLTRVEDGQLSGTRIDAKDSHYRRIRRKLLDMDTRDGTQRAPASQPASNQGPKTRRNARRHEINLDGDDAYARTLRPYVESTAAYVERVANRPLFQCVQNRIDAPGEKWLVLITDDSSREELLETARSAANEQASITVFLLPSVLFSDAGLTDLEMAYNEYVDFEEFRRQLAAINGVTAFEVGPSDRLASILNTASNRRAEG